ncbi:MAG: endonuclease III [Candidatus Methylarchaceae archaeon HK02M2]|nr:endonuclease III [Candidatus Methylarchaceae archaeon HK02M2]
MVQTYTLENTALVETNHSSIRDPFKILIATILSQRTRDENTKKAVQKLFSVYKGMKEISEADEKVIQELIRNAGFYRVKAKKIKEVSKILMERFNGKVPSDFENLISLPSVGRKTANCVLVYGFGKAAIPVDTHVHRITNRLGIVHTKSPEETELELMEIIDKKYWLEFNELLVKFGQSVCKPIKPRCYLCLLKHLCEYYKLNINKET